VISLQDLARKFGASKENALNKEKSRIVAKLSRSLLVKFLTLERTLTHRQIGKLLRINASTVSRIARRPLPIQFASPPPRAFNRLMKCEAGVTFRTSPNATPRQAFDVVS